MSIAMTGMLLLSASLGAEARAAEPANGVIKDGFFLLDDTCHQETTLYLLPVFKTTPPPIKQYLSELSRAADDTISTLNRLQKEDPSIKAAQNPLPLVEQRVRTSFTDAGRQKVIFGTKGPAYVRALLVGELQDSIYIANLAKVMAEDDSDRNRAKIFEKIATRWMSIRDEGYRLLGDVK
jgi:hypothetical protein